MALFVISKIFLVCAFLQIFVEELNLVRGIVGIGVIF
ncbi:uncharacterized protein METZ01_LOCUS308079 [marine metagenome]|uniref:Uncharacterized protein n=1 Tax=marine metagenome TaxID=408172 RepID=A0A382N4H6_9ZZZZ